MHAISSRLDSLSEITGRLTAWLTLLMVLVQVTVVVLRYGFNIGSIATQESITYMHALVFLLGAAYTLKHQAHVRVDIVYQRLSERGQALVDLLGTLLLLMPTALFILISSWDYVMAAWRIHEGSPEAGGLPLVWLLKAAIPVAFVLLILQGVSEVLKSLLVLLSPPATRTGNTEPDQQSALHQDAHSHGEGL